MYWKLFAAEQDGKYLQVPAQMWTNCNDIYSLGTKWRNVIPSIASLGTMWRIAYGCGTPFTKFLPGTVDLSRSIASLSSQPTSLAWQNPHVLGHIGISHDE